MSPFRIVSQLLSYLEKLLKNICKGSMMKVIKYFEVLYKSQEYMEKEIILTIQKANIKISLLSKSVHTFKAIPVKLSPRILWNVTK